jgi:hypothetical protein
MASYSSTSSSFDSQAPTTISPLPRPTLTSPRYNPFPDVPGDAIPKSPRHVWANVTQSPSPTSTSPTSHVTIHEPRPRPLASPFRPQSPSPPSGGPPHEELLATAEKFINFVLTEERKKAGIKKAEECWGNYMVKRYKRYLERLRRESPSPSPGPSKPICNCPDHCQQHKGTSPHDAIIVDADDEPAL